MRGILVIGLGSTYPDSEKLLRMHCFKLAAKRPERVYYGFFRSHNPSLHDILRGATYSEIDDVLVIPFMMSNGRVATHSLPQDIGLESSEDEALNLGDYRMKIRWESSIGSDPAFNGLFVKHLDGFGIDKRSAVILVGFGSPTEPYSRILSGLAQAVIDGGYPHTVVAYSTVESAHVEDGLDLAAGTETSSAVIIPVFLSCGLHVRNEICSKLGLNSRTFRGTVLRNDVPVSVSVLPPVGMMDIVTDIMVRKAERVFDGRD